MDSSSDFQFLLPMQTSDLLNSSGDNYYVQEVFSSADIPEKLLACKQKLQQGDPFYIFEHFDTYYSVIECNSTNEASTTKNLMRSFDLLYITVDKLGALLTPLLGASDTPSSQDRIKYLNLTKMSLFLFVNTVRKIDAVIQRTLQQQQYNQQSKKRGKHEATLTQYPDWDVKRGKFLVQLYNILQCQLEKLWSPPVVEENFVNMICDICYRTLELLHVRPDSRHICDTIFQIFGTAIKRYNHAIVFPVRILQILRTVEHSSASVATGIQLLHEEFGITSIFSMLITDIVEALTLDSADSTVSRNFSNFLTELANIAPKLMIPHISTLCEELLGCESYVLRNCVLQIMGDAVVGELTSEELSDDLKEARNEFLENLLAHINDISAHVRSKVLQIWHNLKEEHAVPLSFLVKVLCEAVSRLEDKTSTVRKGAVQLIKAFLENNPFSGKLTLEELIEQHAKEVENMEELNEKLKKEGEKIETLMAEWETIIMQILPFIEKNLREHPQIEYNNTEEYKDIVLRIMPLLIDKKYEEAMVLARRADLAAGNPELMVSELKIEEKCVYFMALFKTFVVTFNERKNESEEMQKQIKTVQFLEDSIEFSKVITKAMPKIQELLMSKTNSDVFEAVDLFTTGYLFGIKGTESGMQQMLYLIWSSDKEKRDAVSNAYRKVLFTTDLTGRAHAIKVVQNLSHFLQVLDYGHYMAMESLIREWVSTEDIDVLIIQVLFERFTMKLEGTTNNESRLALQLLIMASQEKSTIASANIGVIETIGMGERAKCDPRVFAACLDLLLNSIDASKSSNYYKRYDPDNPFVVKIIKLFLAFFFHPQLPDFDRLAMSTLEFFYKLCQTPDIIAQNIINELIKKLSTSWLQTNETRLSQEQPRTSSDEIIPYTQDLPETQRSSCPVDKQKQMRIPVYLCSRLIFLIGFMTLKEMIFLDIDVYNNMKYRQELTEQEEKANKNKNIQNPVRRQAAANLNMSATEARKRLSGSTAEPQQEPDDDLVGATAEDNIAEEINAVCEDMLLYADNALLAKLFPIIVEICKKPGQYRDQNLQQAATLTLTRLMTVSSKFCASNMSFLMNILHLTKNIKIKCNNVIGLTDLTFRFPNIIEPWTGHFYSTLHETNTELRLTAVKMLSQLILHEMIRVKGQIADLAMCIVDPDDEIKNITQEFFKEIANKSNILYNVLPDIISKLSDTKLNLEEEKYHIIMRHILGLIQKDRQVETLVEKLCLRFPVTREERQWRDIAYCLSLLTYNERSIKKLVDNLQHYRDKVQIDEVYQSFKTIISNTGKLAKPELKAAVTEFETRINECLKVRDGDDTTSPESGGGVDLIINPRPTQSLSSGRAANRNKQRAKGAKSTGRRGRKKDTSSEDDSSDEPPKNKRQTANKKIVSSEESSDSSEGEAAAAVQRKEPTQLSNSRNKVIESTSDSDEPQTPQLKRGRRGK